MATIQLNLNIPFECDTNELPDLNISTHDNNDEYTIPDLNLDSQLDVGLQESHEESNLNGDAIEELSQPLQSVKMLSNFTRTAIYEMLLQKSVDGKLKRGVTKMVASHFSTSIQTIQRIWRQSNYGEGAPSSIYSRKVKNCGRKKIDIDYNLFRQIPLRKRTTLQSLACAMNMSRTTLFRRLKSGDIRRHSNAIKPYLKDENKISRLRFCISMLDGGSIPHDPVFTAMYNVVHIDEKWFYMTKKSEIYYLLSDEEDPIRTTKSKNFIEKVMFLVAVARPRFDGHGVQTFSGKIGVFPFVKQERARRASVNRVAGTMETKPITSITKEVSRSYLIDKVLPSIKAKWPREDSNSPIFIQQDNARTHVQPNDEEFCRAATQDGFDIRLMCQPPNSPDLNVLDLGYFRAIQSLQHKESPKGIDDLVKAVTKSYEDFSTEKSNYIFLTLQSCMIEIMRAKGSHNYKIQHLSKAMLARKDQLPTQLKCDPELVQETLNYLG